MKFWMVDAFTNIAFRGNPAGVMVFDKYPHDSLMQDIANELQCSNSGFVERTDKPNHFKIRWFTPHSEAPICGHATLASAHILFQEGIATFEDKITFESRAGILGVSKTDDWYNLNFPAFAIKELSMENLLIRQVIENGIKPIYIGESENCLLMEFASVDDLYTLEPDIAGLKKMPYRALIATSSGNKVGKYSEYDFLSRYFAPKVEIYEDPVCASAHCRLIPYWNKKLNKTQMLAYQASSRGGVLKCELLEGQRVQISGQALTVVLGEFINYRG
jgi:PhzF family phenazine biosynthesis protein